MAHKYYLINIRLPVNERKGINVGIGEIKDIRLVVSVCLAAPPQRDCAPRCSPWFSSSIHSRSPALLHG